MSGRYGLPHGARAITVTVGSGERARTDTYYQSEQGMLMRARAVGTTQGAPAGLSGMSVSDIYKNAVRRGLRFELHSQKQVDEANASYRQNKESNFRDVAYAELHPRAGKAGYSAKRLRI